MSFGRCAAEISQQTDDKLGSLEAPASSLQPRPRRRAEE